MAQDDDEPDCLGESAYVALLHGSEREFFLYALLLGDRLFRLDRQTPRVLMVGRGIKGEKGLPDYPSPFLESPARETLAVKWQVKEVNLIDAPVADKTSRKRHRFVFTKLRAFEVPYQKIIFFDLDIIVRRSPAELFQVPAPAGMYHGHWDRSNTRHGEPIPEEAFYDHGRVGCINAGLMRLDPPSSKKERRQKVDDLVKKVHALTEKEQSYLPEQYFLVKQLKGWRHIEVSWNCEVTAEWFIQSVHRNNRRNNNKDKADKALKAVEVLKAEMPDDWWALGSEEQLGNRVGMFHFSGTWLYPWWYAHLPPLEAKKMIKEQYKFRDARGMMALAVFDWLSALQELRKCESFQPEQAAYLRDVIERYEYISQYWWDETEKCEKCKMYKDEEICEECLVKAKLNPSGETLPGSNKKRPRLQGKASEKDRQRPTNGCDSRKVSDATTASELSCEEKQKVLAKDAKGAKGKKPRGGK